MKNSFYRAAGLIALALTFCTGTVFAQSDDDWFFDDDIFADDVVIITEDSSSAGKSDLNHGIIFDTGSVRLGGTIDTSLKLNVPLYNPDSDKTLGDNIYASTLSPTADAELFVDARPAQNLRLYTKFGWSYPYNATISGSAIKQTTDAYGITLPPGATIPDISLGTSRLYVKELFTDFSIADRVFFRFGQHTVSWGTGYFYSPVSDMINSSSIDAENPTAQVNGSLNLRTQIIFPGTQNTLWFYIVPSANFDEALAPYARDTALAAKGEFVLGGWELGAGALYKYQTAPKIMFTASGSIIKGKVAVFGESVFRYGTDLEWKTDSENWSNKTFGIAATVGAGYMWKDPKINFMAQYYFDSDFDDHQYSTYGSNLALTVMFQKLGTEKLTGMLMGLFNFGKDSVSLTDIQELYMSGKSSFSPYTAITSAMLTYAPVKNISLSGGPYITWESWTKAPTVSLQITAKLGGGAF